MLGRAGIDSVLIDGHHLYPKDFRCEKLDTSQIDLLRKTGLLDAVARAATPDREVWVARFGRVVERRPSAQLDILYEDLVNTIRAEVPQGIHFIQGKATGITTGAERQHIRLSTGEELSVRLIVLANGLNIGLRHNVGIERQVISPSHSISIGFDLEPVGRTSFDFRALTYYTEATHSRSAYVTFFPIGPAMRANLFVYRDMDDPWLREMRHDGSRALFTLMPRLRALTGEIGVCDVKIRPVDLYVSRGHRQGGIVLVGDAFATSCPAAGTGCNKVFTDVERLCNAHIPRWLATPGMGKEKIAQFYDDEVKVACDAFAAAKAFYLRSLSVETAPTWHARRWLKFLGHAGKGGLRALGERLAIPALDRAGAAAGGSAG
jgi:2-polyprenyl-6-methoxyphenol hydroxylase-like FAD-dependent oxidoreductase